MTVSIPLFVTLLAATVWTTGFSLSVNPGIRGYRNLGLLACYVSPLVFLFIAGWRAVAVAWVSFGLAGGVIYTAWALFQRRKAPGPDTPKVGFGHFLPGLAAWPIMIPEAVENTLATAGILKPENKSTPRP